MSKNGKARWTRWLKLLPLLVIATLVVRQRFLVPIQVHAFTVERGDVVREAFGRGTIESRREAQLGFDLIGKISDVRVDEGDRVKLGQVLASLAPEQYSADVKTATDSASLARAAIARLEAEEKRATATLDFTSTEEARAKALAQTGALSPRDVDLAVQQLALARAELDRVHATREEAQRQITLAAQNVAVRSVTAARAVLISPFDGVVIRRLHDPGDTVTIGTTVLRVVATDALWSRAWIDETALPALRDKQVARIRVGASGAPTLKGTVDRIGREADRQTHELLVDVRLDSFPERVAIGQRADVWIELDRKYDVVRVPLSFVRREGQATYCFVNRAGRIARAELTVGLEGQELVEVTGGLAAGDVVLSGADAGAILLENRRWEALP
jgi:HlyD family secretion protein